MPLKFVQVVPIGSPPVTYTNSAFGLFNLAPVSLRGSADIISAILSDVLPAINTTGLDFLYGVHWTATFNITNPTNRRFKEFDGNPTRRNYGYYSVQRSGAVVDFDIAAFDTFCTKTYAFTFGNASQFIDGFANVDAVPNLTYLRFFGRVNDGGGGAGFATMVDNRRANVLAYDLAPGLNATIQIQYTLNTAFVLPGGDNFFGGIFL